MPQGHPDFSLDSSGSTPTLPLAHCGEPVLISIGSTQGCVLSPLVYTLYTCDWISTYNSNTIVKFADDTTEENESAYRDEIEQLIKWCSENNLLLNTSKTKELVIDYRKKDGYSTFFAFY